MKKLLLMIGMMILPVFAMAATPDFNGSWVRNASSSDTVPNQMYWTTRTGNTMRGRRATEIVLNAHLEGKNLSVAESNEILRTYTLDGAPHTRATDTGIQKAVDTASMQGDNLVIETVEPFGGMPGNATLKIKQVWSLSPDGKTLTITTTREVPARQQMYKEVYNRAQNESGEVCSAGCVVLH